MRVAVQPCGDSAAKEHFVDTIKNLVPKSRIYPFLDENQRKQFDHSCGEEVAVWGVTEGKSGQNKTKWQKLRPGDVALLYTNKVIFNKARISLCLQNALLAEDLWSTNAEGKTWEFIYFLDELQEIHLPIEKFNEALNYKSNYIIQGFNVLEEDKATAIAGLLGEDTLSEESPNESLTADAFRRQLEALVSTDLPANTKARQESQIFRRFLFGNARSHKCDLCNRSLPARLLVAAHIKPRSDCDDSERRDPNIVFRACKLGCDELFERSYVVVDDQGLIEGTVNLSKSTDDLKNYADSLVGKQCNAFNEQTREYFGWRRTHMKRFLT